MPPGVHSRTPPEKSGATYLIVATYDDLVGGTMFKSFLVGAPLGIPVRIQGLFVVFFALLGGYFLATEGPGRGLNSIFFLGAAFFFVLLHEFGHALVAKNLGANVKDITIWPLGGMARLEDVPGSSLSEIVIALAGPVVNLVLAYQFFCLHKFFLVLEAGPVHVMGFMAWINLLLALFNIIPAFPLDGGRILRGCLALSLGFEIATKISVFTGRAFALAICGAAFYLSMPLLILVSVFVFHAAGQEERDECTFPSQGEKP